MAQLQVKFFTKPERFKVDESPFSVLGTVTVVELNEVINKLLSSQGDDEDFQKREFEFLVDSEILRSSLIDHINEKGLSVESVLPLEYFEKQTAPELELCLEHNDWVSGIRLSENFILSGSYDCALNVWNRKNGAKVCSVVEHSEPIKAVAWIHHNKENMKHFISASQDQNVILWQFNTESLNLKPLFRCKGHSKSVDCLSVNKSNTKFVSGSWDCNIKVWSTLTQPEGGVEEQFISELSGRKRHKVERKGFPRSPKLTLAGHKEAVTGLVWLNESEICSASWDHTLRLWDLEQVIEVSQQRGTKAITSLDYSPLNKTVVTGNTDRHIRLWDPRSSEGAVIKSSLTSHRNWVTCVSWSPTTEHCLVSGALDNFVKMWDIRSPKTPLFDLDAHEDKVMCVDWTLPGVVASGGADNKAYTFSTADGSIERSLS